MNIIVINLSRDEDILEHKRERMIANDGFKQGLLFQ